MLPALFSTLLVLQTAPAPGAASTVRSANGRFQATLTPRAGDAEARVDLVLESIGEKGERAKRWSGVLPASAPSARVVDLVSDDGAAFVRIDASPGDGVALREVFKGVNAGAWSLHDLGWASSELPSGSATWIDAPRALRWRSDDTGLNSTWMLDLLGRDGGVRTLELDGGALTVHADESAALDLLVHPPVPEPILAGTKPTYVDAWSAPRLAIAGRTIEVDGRGHDPSEGWHFVGFRVLGNPFTTKRLVLEPRGGFPRADAAQVVRPHLWTARFNGLPPGLFTLDFCGAETDAGDARRDPTKTVPIAPADATHGPRVLEIVSPHQIAELRSPASSAGDASPFRSIALFDDGRVELVRADDAKRVELATLADWRAIEGRVAALAEPRARWTASPEDERAMKVLTWRGSEVPARVRVDARSDGGVRALADELERVARSFETTKAASSVGWRLDVAASSVHVKTASAGLFSAFGHDHELAASTFDATFDVDERDVWRSRVSLSVDAASLHVVDAESKDDAPKIEKNMNDEVLETARFPKIAFEGKTLAPRAGEPEGRELAWFARKTVEVAITGELTLHGVTKTIRVPGKLAIDGDTLTVRGDLALKQTDYGITPYSAVGGAVKVDDKLRVVYELVARRGR